MPQYRFKFSTSREQSDTVKVGVSCIADKMEHYLNEAPQLLKWAAFTSPDCARLTALGSADRLKAEMLLCSTDELMTRFGNIIGNFESVDTFRAIFTNLRPLARRWLEVCNELVGSADAVESKELFQSHSMQEELLSQRLTATDNGADSDAEESDDEDFAHMMQELQVADLDQRKESEDDRGNMQSIIAALDKQRGASLSFATATLRSASRGRVYTRAGVATSERVNALVTLLTIVLQLPVRAGRQTAFDCFVEFYLRLAREATPGDAVARLSALDLVTLAVLFVTVTDNTELANLLTTATLAMQNVKYGIGGYTLGTTTGWVKAAASRVTINHFCRTYVTLTAPPQATVRRRVSYAIGVSYGYNLACAISGFTRPRMVAAWRREPEIWLGSPELAAGDDIPQVHWVVKSNGALQKVTSSAYEAILLAMLGALDASIQEFAESILPALGTDLLRRYMELPESHVTNCSSVRSESLTCTLHAFEQLQDAATSIRAAAAPVVVPLKVVQLLQACMWLAAGPLCRPADAMHFVESNCFVRVLPVLGAFTFCNVPIHKQQTAFEDATVLIHPVVLRRLFAVKLFVRDGPVLAGNDMLQSPPLDLLLAQACCRVGLRAIPAYLMRKVCCNRLALFNMCVHASLRLTSCCVCSQISAAQVQHLTLALSQHKSARRPEVDQHVLALHRIAMHQPASTNISEAAATVVQGVLTLQSGHVHSSAESSAYFAAQESHFGCDETSRVTVAAECLVRSNLLFRYAWLPNLEAPAGTGHDPLDDALTVRLAEAERRILALAREEIAAFDAFILQSNKGIRPGVFDAPAARARAQIVTGFRTAVETALNDSVPHILVGAACGARKSSIPILAALAASLRFAASKGDDSDGAPCVVMVLPTIQLSLDLLQNHLLKRYQSQFNLRVAVYKAGMMLSKVNLLIAPAESLVSGSFVAEVRMRTIRIGCLAVDELDSVLGEASFRPAVFHLMGWCTRILRTRLICMSGVYDRTMLSGACDILGMPGAVVLPLPCDRIDGNICINFTLAERWQEAVQKVASVTKQLVLRQRADGMPTKVIVVAMTKEHVAVLQQALTHELAGTSLHVDTTVAGKPSNFLMDGAASSSGILIGTSVAEVGLSSTYVDAVVYAGGAYALSMLVQGMHRSCRNWHSGRLQQVLEYIYCPTAFRLVVGRPGSASVLDDRESLFASRVRDAMTAFEDSPPDVVARATLLHSLHGMQQFHTACESTACIAQFLRAAVNDDDFGTAGQSCGTCSSCRIRQVDVLTAPASLASPEPQRGSLLPSGWPMDDVDALEERIAAPVRALHVQSAPELAAMFASTSSPSTPALRPAGGTLVPSPMVPFTTSTPEASAMRVVSTAVVSEKLQALRKLLLDRKCMFCTVATCSGNNTCAARVALLGRRSTGWCFECDSGVNHGRAAGNLSKPCPIVVRSEDRSFPGIHVEHAGDLPICLHCLWPTLLSHDERHEGALRNCKSSGWHRRVVSVLGAYIALKKPLGIASMASLISSINSATRTSAHSTLSVMQRTLLTQLADGSLMAQVYDFWYGLRV